MIEASVLNSMGVVMQRADHTVTGRARTARVFRVARFTQAFLHSSGGGARGEGPTLVRPNKGEEELRNFQMPQLRDGTAMQTNACSDPYCPFALPSLACF